MSSIPQRSSLGRVYLTAVPWLGTAVLTWALTDLFLRPPNSAWLALATLTILTGSFTVKIPGLVARLSVSEPFVFAATLWFGPSVGAVTAALDALIMSLWLMPGLKTLHRLSFNISVLVISIWTASQIFFGISGIDVRAPQYTSLTSFVGPLYIFTACCFLLNSGMVATALAIERRQSGLRIWREQFLWLSLNYFGGASVAALLVVYAKSIDWAVIGLIVPLLAISYLTFRTTLGRLEDANDHLSELNKLHLSTIETLAMAVDAKDQVTHGHIRRVQRYALGLSHYLGITDIKLLKAVEAAALLHDMGKLAIPEYILNKPGKLTPAEFEKMKLHAALGADILSAIQFPYPVVPIVRHHHENWDGSGYPDKLRGTEIPLGARILSVVDCYDALTSDRPYRPKLSTTDAIAIVMQRRGSMYDPLVVDTFVTKLEELERSTEDLGPVNPTLFQIAELNSPLVHPQQTGERRQQLELQSVLLSTDVAPLALGLSGRPSNIVGCAFYISSSKSTDMRAVSVSGLVPRSLLGSTTELGERVIGWSGSTGTPVRNAPLELEFGPSKPFEAATCSAFPARTGNEMLAVLAVFADERGLSEADASKLESISVDLSHSVSDDPGGALSASVAFDEQILNRVLPVDRTSAAACFPLGVLAVKVPEEPSFELAAAKCLVRSTDSVLQVESGTFVFVLQRASESSVATVMERIRSTCNSSGILPKFEWAILNELTDSTAGDVSNVIATVGARFLGQVSTKLH
jgi:putative nucleotidyltransferase with HDIG domain